MEHRFEYLFFNKRLSLDIEYYNNTDCDLITTIPVNEEFGYKYRYANGMKVRNSGVEMTLSGKPLKILKVSHGMLHSPWLTIRMNYYNCQKI